MSIHSIAPESLVNRLPGVFDDTPTCIKHVAAFLFLVQANFIPISSCYLLSDISCEGFASYTPCSCSRLQPFCSQNGHLHPLLAILKNAKAALTSTSLVWLPLPVRPRPTHLVLIRSPRDHCFSGVWIFQHRGKRYPQRLSRVHIRGYQLSGLWWTGFLRQHQLSQLCPPRRPSRNVRSQFLQYQVPQHSACSRGVLTG